MELVWVSEGDLDEWCATARVVDDILDYTSNVSMLLGVVELSELGRCLVESLVGSCTKLSVIVAIVQCGNDRTEDRAAALSLVANDSTHPARLLEI